VEKSGEMPIKGTGLAAQQEIRIAATSLDQQWLRIGVYQN